MCRSVPQIAGVIVSGSSGSSTERQQQQDRPEDEQDSEKQAVGEGHEPYIGGDGRGRRRPDLLPGQHRCDRRAYLPDETPVRSARGDDARRGLRGDSGSSAENGPMHHRHPPTHDRKRHGTTDRLRDSPQMRRTVAEPLHLLSATP
jgi:hypothetical protein